MSEPTPRNWKSASRAAPRLPPASVRRATVVAVASAKCQSPAEELDILIRARYPIIYLVSWEEERVEQCLAEIAERRKKKLYMWTLDARAGQVRCRAAASQRERRAAPPIHWPRSTRCSTRSNRRSFCSRIFIPSWKRTAANLAVVRRLRDVAVRLRDTYKTIVIVVVGAADGPRTVEGRDGGRAGPARRWPTSTGCWTGSSKT